MIGKKGPVDPKLFTYVRYNADLSQEGLDKLGLGNIRPEDVQRMDSVEHIPELQQVGKAVARNIDRHHFNNFLE